MAVEKLVLITKRTNWLYYGVRWYEHLPQMGYPNSWWGYEEPFDYYWTPTDCWLFTSEGRDFVLP